MSYSSLPFNGYLSCPTCNKQQMQPNCEYVGDLCMFCKCEEKKELITIPFTTTFEQKVDKLKALKELEKSYTIIPDWLKQKIADIENYIKNNT